MSDLGINDKLPIVLIFGGSQGAKKINDCITNILIWFFSIKKVRFVKVKINEALDYDLVGEAK